MDFETCILAAIEGGRLKPKRGEEAIKAYKEAFEEAKGLGASDRAADDTAAMKAMEFFSKRSVEGQWAKRNEIRVAAEQTGAIKESNRPDRWIRQLWNKIDISHTQHVGMAHATISGAMNRWRSRNLGLKRPTDGQAELIDAQFGLPVSPMAKQNFEEIKLAKQALWRRANHLGATMIEDESGVIGFKPDRGRLNELIKSKGNDVEAGRLEFIDDYMKALDWDRVSMDTEGGIPLPNRVEWLDKQFRAIRSEGNNLRSETMFGESSLAGRLSRDKRFYYKDAPTWKAMHAKYGHGSIFQAVITDIEMLARDVALMEHLGPHPWAMMNLINNVALKRSEEIDNLRAKSAIHSDSGTKTKEAVIAGNSAYEIYNNRTSDGSENLFAQGTANTRQFLNTVLLHGAFISQALEPIFKGRHALAKYGLKQGSWAYAGKVYKAFATMGVQERRLALMRSEAMMDSFISQSLAAVKYIGPIDGSSWMRQLSDTAFRTTLMTPMVQASRGVALQHMWQAYADRAGVRWADLDKHLRAGMEEWGIAEVDWDMFRATAISEPNGVKELRPSSMLTRTDADKIDLERTSNKFFAFALDVTRQMVPELNTMSRVSLGHDVSPNTFKGQVLKAVGFLKSFPMLMIQQLRDEWNQPGLGRSPLKAVAKFVLVMTAAGAFIQQIKELIQGRDPANMTTMQFWVKSLLLGGALGWAGDLLFGVFGQFQHGGMAESMAGPQPELFDRLLELTVEDQVDFLTTLNEEGWDAAVEKYEFGRDLGAFINRYNPVPWYARLIFQRAFLDELLHSMNPKAYEFYMRNQRARERTGQGSWWPMGEAGPTRAPNWGAAIGQGG